MDDEHGTTDRRTLDSRPNAWLRLRRGINFWVKDHKQIYLVVNPMIWWLSTLAVRSFLILRAKRGFRDLDNTEVVKYDCVCSFLFLGWFPYFPFYLMASQLFLHHYLPALYFAILLLASWSLDARVHLQIVRVLVILAVWNSIYLGPLANGNQWTKRKRHSAKWLKITSRGTCLIPGRIAHHPAHSNDFPDSYKEYAHVAYAAACRRLGAQAGEREAEQTSPFAAKPEPEHDIFADDRQDARSKARPPPCVADAFVMDDVTTDADSATAFEASSLGVGVDGGQRWSPPGSSSEGIPSQCRLRCVKGKALALPLRMSSGCTADRKHSRMHKHYAPPDASVGDTTSSMSISVGWLLRYPFR